MRMLAFVSFLALMLAGCNSSEKQMLEAVRSKLKDPDSAKFTQLDMKATSDGTMEVLCGMLNAKNSYGGYIGARSFTATKSKREEGVFVNMDESADCAKARQIAETVTQNRGKR